MASPGSASSSRRFPERGPGREGAEGWGTEVSSSAAGGVAAVPPGRERGRGQGGGAGGGGGAWAWQAFSAAAAGHGYCNVPVPHALPIKMPQRPRFQAVLSPAGPDKAPPRALLALWGSRGPLAPVRARMCLERRTAAQHLVGLFPGKPWPGVMWLRRPGLTAASWNCLIWTALCCCSCHFWGQLAAVGKTVGRASHPGKMGVKEPGFCSRLFR